MSIEFLIFAGIAVLFFLGIALKEKFPKVCPICLAISLSWLGLLIAREVGALQTDALTAILIGESIVGFYYFADSKIAEKLKVFRLPALLTLTFAGYSIIIKKLNNEIAVFLLFLWILFVALYFLKNTKARELVKKIIACCKNW